MQIMKFSAALLSVGLLMAAPSFAQSVQAKKQHTQEGGAPAISEPCALPYNADPAADPDCTQHTQNLVPSVGQDSNIRK